MSISDKKRLCDVILLDIEMAVWEYCSLPLIIWHLLY